MFKEMFQETDKRLQAAQATIADLQGQLKEMTESQKRCWNEWTLAEQNVESLQQRVAQLEQERDAFESHAIDLQADHARVLGLVQALPIGSADKVDEALRYFCDTRAAVANLFAYAASLPAQPVCTNHFSDGSKIFPSRECACKPAQPAQGARCDQCGTRLAHEDHKYDCPYMIVKRQHAEGETRA